MTNKILCLLLSVTFSFNVIAATEFHYVTNDGAGVRDGLTWASAFSMADFSDIDRWSTEVAVDRNIGPDDTVCFAGTITSYVDVKGSGTPDNKITFDGWCAGSYDAINRVPDPSRLTKVTKVSASASLFRIVGKKHLVIQDFEFDGNQGLADEGFYIYNLQDEPAEDITIRRNYIHHVKNRGVFVGRIGILLPTARNIVVGGAYGQGNEFYAIGNSTAGYDVKLAYTSDWVVSYNKMHADPSGSEFGVSGVSWGNSREQTQNGLVEYNYICCHNSTNGGESGIGGKGGSSIIIRYNHVAGHTQNFGESNGIYAGWGDAENIYVYGNFVQGNFRGISVSTGSGSSINNNGIPVESIYIWGNIVADTTTMDAIVVGGWSGEDTHENIHIVNNTIVNNAIDPTNYAATPPVPGPYTGVSVIRTSQDVKVLNNLFVDNRPGAQLENRSQIYVQNNLNDEVSVVGNLFYHSSGTPTIRAGNTHNSVTSWGAGNIIDDPGFLPALDGIYLPSSNGFASEGGLAIEGLVGSVTINGQVYDMRWSDGLDPNTTSWTDGLPSVGTASRGGKDSPWGMGAYTGNIHNQE